jgi:drug/metabolite transporter (DMT)-like permease
MLGSVLSGVETLSLSSLRDDSAATWVALIALCVFSSALAMVLWMFLLKRLEVGRSSVSIYPLPWLGDLIPLFHCTRL